MACAIRPCRARRIAWRLPGNPNPSPAHRPSHKFAPQSSLTNRRPKLSGTRVPTCSRKSENAITFLHDMLALSARAHVLPARRFAASGPPINSNDLLISSPDDSLRTTSGETIRFGAPIVAPPYRRGHGPGGSGGFGGSGGSSGGGCSDVIIAPHQKNAESCQA